MSKTFINEGLELFSKHKDDEKELPSIMVEYATNKYPKLNSRASALSKLKRAIIDKHYADGEIPKHVAAIQLTRDQYNSVNADQAAALVRKTNDCVQINNCDEWAMRILSGITSDSPAELFTAVVLCCGRRTVEVNATGVFTPADNPYEARFSGSAKRRGDDDRSYVIPLLLPYRQFIAGFTRWRGMLSANHKLIHQSTLGKFVKDVTGMPKLSPHSLRSVYAMICYEKYAPPNQSIAGYVSQILGHQSANVSVHYSCIKLSGCSKKPYKLMPTVSDFVAETRGEVAAVDKIVKLLAAGTPITLNELRRQGTSHPVAKRVLENNRALL